MIFKPLLFRSLFRLSYEFIQNIRLTLKFRRICSVFLNHQVNDWQREMLMKTITIMKKVIKGRPTVQYYMQCYRGDKIWQTNSYNNQYKVKYITYLHSVQYRHFRNAKSAMVSFLYELEFLSMGLNWKQVTTQEKEIVKEHRRCKGLQLEMINNIDEIEIINIDSII